MIMLTKLNGDTFAINPDLIEIIEETPDTNVRLTNKTFFIVRENTQEVIQKIIRYRRSYHDVLDRISPNR